MLLLVVLVLSIGQYICDPCLPQSESNPGGYASLRSQELRSAANDQTLPTALCDRNLYRAWYRIFSRAGAMMPETCVPEYRCGTKSPIWLLGTHPTVEEDVVTLRACVNAFGHCCTDQIPLNIQVKNCTDFYVYELLPAPGCPMAYCFGEEIKCPDGQTSPSGGYTPGCADPVDGEINGKPTIEVTKDSDPTKLNLLCHISYDAGGNIVVDVEWGSGDILLDQATLEQGEQTHSLQQDKWASLVSLGNEVVCNARVLYNNGSIGKWEEGEPLFLGIKILTPSLTVSEVGFETAELQIETTIPYLCEGDCVLPVIAWVPPAQDPNPPRCEREDYREIAQLVFVSDGEEGTACGVNITGESQRRFQQGQRSGVYTMKITGFQDWKMDDLRTRTIQLRTSNNAENPLWKGYVIGNVEVTIKDTETRSYKTCSAASDPRIDTFDNGLYDVNTCGEYVMFEHQSIPLQMNLDVVYCSPGSTGKCICGFSIITHDPTMAIDHRPCWYRVHISNCEATSNNRATIDVKRCGCKDSSLPTNDGRKYEFSFGMLAMTAKVHYSTSSSRAYITRVEIRADDSILGNFGGLCGEVDNECMHDFKLPDHTMLLRNEPCRRREWPHPVNFTGSWMSDSKHCALRTPPAESYRCHANVWGQKIQRPRSTNYCTCLEESEDMVCSGHLNSKADVCSGKPMDMDPTFQDCGFTSDTRFCTSARAENKHQNDWTEDSAKEYCENHILSSKAGEACSSIPSLDFTGPLSDCVADIMVSNDTEWAEVSLENLKGSCVDEMGKNISMWESGSEGSVPKPPADISENLCLGDCGGHGVCDEGSCVCDEGYAGTDCGVDLKLPPELRAISWAGLCDVTELACEEATLFGWGFVDLGNLSCQIRFAMATPNGLEVSSDTSHLKSIFVHLGASRCPLPAWVPPRHVQPQRSEDVHIPAYTLAVSNNGRDFSTETNLILHDPVCEHCDSQAGTCVLKADSCRIQGHCIPGQAIHENDPCLLCDPEKDSGDWSSDPGCSGGSVWPYIVGGIAGALVIASVVGAVVIKAKLKRKNVVQPSTGELKIRNTEDPDEMAPVEAFNQTDKI